MCIYYLSLARPSEGVGGRKATWLGAWAYTTQAGGWGNIKSGGAPYLGVKA